MSLVLASFTLIYRAACPLLVKHSTINLSLTSHTAGPAQPDTVLAVALFEIRPFLAFANFVACYGLGLQRINTSLLWASPVPGTSTNQHLCSVCGCCNLPLIPHHPSDDFSKLSQRYNETRNAEQSDDTQGTPETSS